jgi:hypothetical protein
MFPTRKSKTSKVASTAHLYQDQNSVKSVAVHSLPYPSNQTLVEQAKAASTKLLKATNEQAQFKTFCLRVQVL